MIRTQQQRRKDLIRRRRIQAKEQQQAPQKIKFKPTPPKPAAKARKNLLIVGKLREPTEDAQQWKEAYVVGGGPSLRNFDWNCLNNKFTIGINRAYEVLPNAQIIYFTDDDWYELHKKRGFLNHKGRKIKGSLNVKKYYNDKHIEQMHLTGEKGLELTPGKLRHGRNSTYAVINMLIQWGFKKIYLLGIDMKHQGKQKNNNRKEHTHWHDGHKRIDSEGAYRGFSRNYDDAAPLIKQLGVEVINVNNDTNLKAFPIKKYEEVFGPNCFIK